MSRWHNQYLNGHAHFCTATVSEWRPLLQRNAVTLVYEEWETARQVLAVQILAYVVMPEHFHTVLWAEQGRSISRFLQRTLGLTSHRLQPGGGLWKERPRVLPVWSRRVLKTKVDYLHANPVRRGLVEFADQWEHSSFRQIEIGLTQVPFLCDSWEMVL